MLKHFAQHITFLHLWFIIGLFGGSIALSTASHSQIQYPSLQGYINDEAHLLDQAIIDDLTKKLFTLEKETGAQLVIATVTGLSGIDIETYSNSLFRTWQLGKEKIDNGILLIIAPKERKVRIEVGYGLEGKLTDAISAIIINNFIVPNFHEENYQEGITKAVNAIIDIVAGNNSDILKAKGAPKHSKANDKKEAIITNLVLLLLFFTMVCLPILAMIFGKKVAVHKYRWMGITFTLWFINPNFTTKYRNKKFNEYPHRRRFRGGGGSSGGGGASGRW
ncbi:TPM domain-containing protein [Bartonella ancashensis]|uniref:Beta-propeller domains of methanol dehydrogenase type n=1 Tax=Bartonella ancashensis TaxID=1318743 RepID=A0A0M4M406_9HYPH|nr:TPM domain-containing protein [Bartonella ancashensis]ALE03824.1 Beta-propeller domains of methanol dehydrogenase type [Bartonella ancashensis]